MFGGSHSSQERNYSKLERLIMLIISMILFKAHLVPMLFVGTQNIIGTGSWDKEAVT